MEFENNLITNKHILFYGNKNSTWDTSISSEFDYVMNNFCGIVLNQADYHDLPTINQPNTIIYFCGKFYNLDKIQSHIFIIKNLTFNLDELRSNMHFINSGKVPINIHNVGVFFRNLFDSRKNYFDLVTNEHEFQTLTESNKPSNAYRTGIYLTPVTKKEDGIEFKLLRCSSNLGGPTDNFREIDHEIVTQLNEIVDYFFDKKTCLNHVLAQVYNNDGGKKAKIKAHSDKTKDMPRNGLIAFCTFYKDYVNNTFTDISKSNTDYFNYCYRSTSVLTVLRFRLKHTKKERLIEKFDVILYPNSVFLMPLSTNRLYTHEIIPSGLPIDKIPTRMGYVVRCSKTKAIFKDGKTWLINCDNLTELIEPDDEGFTRLKDFYHKENTSCDIINYDNFNFSLNNGDYLEPLNH